MKSTKLAAAACVAASVFALGTACAGALRFAAESSYAPFIFVNSKTGQQQGFEIDLMKAVAKKLGDTLVVTNMGFDAVIPSLVTGTADVGGSAITITEERAKKVNFTQAYYDSGTSILINKSDENSVRSIDDLEGAAVCVQIGTSGAMRSAKIPGVTLRQFNAVNEAYMELRNKGCKAVITDRPVTAYFMNSRKANARLFTHLPQTLEPEQYGFAVTKNKPELVDRINGAINQLRRNGEFQKIYEKWFGK